MISFQTTLGNYSNNVNPVFLPKTRSPSIIIIPQENFVELLSLKSGKNIAVLRKSSKKFIKIVILEVQKSKKLKTVSIAIGFEDGCIQVWKINAMKTSIFCTILKGHMIEISKLCYHEEKCLLLSGCKSGCLVLWDIDKKKGILRIKKAHSGEIDFYSFITKIKNYSNIILSSGNDNFIKFWDLKTGSCLKIINIGIKIDYGFEIKNNKIIIFSKRKSKIFFLRIENLCNISVEKRIKISTKFNEPKILTSKKNNIIFIYGKNKKIEILLLKKNFFLNNKESKKLGDKIKIEKDSKFFKEKIKTLDFWENKNSKEIFLLIQYHSNFIDVLKIIFSSKKNQKKQLKFINIFRNKLEWCQSDIRELIWFSNDFFLASLSGFSKTVNIWFLHSQKCPRIFPLNSKGLCMALNTNNNILVGTKEGGLDLFDISSGTLIFSKFNAHVGPIWTLEIINNFFQLATGGTDGILKLWEFDQAGINLLKYLEIGEQILGMKIISKKNIIAVNCLSSKLLFFQFTNLQFSFSFDGYSMPIISMAIDHEDSLLVTGSTDNFIRIWSLNHRELKKSISHHNSAITSVCFQKFNGNFFSGSRCGKICFWEEKNYILLSEINNFHTGPIWALKVSENGKFLASGSQCKKLILWKIDEIENLTPVNLEKYKNKQEIDQSQNSILGSFNSHCRRKMEKMDLDTIQLLENEKSEEVSELSWHNIVSENLNKFTKNKWLDFVKNLKKDQILKFLDVIFENSKKSTKNDIFSILGKLLKLLKILKKTNSTIEFKKLKIFEKKIKMFIHQGENTIDTNLRTLELLKKSLKFKGSDLPDSN